MAIDFTKSYPVIEWDLNNYHFFTKYFGKKEENAKGFKVQIMQDGEVLTPTTETLRIYCKKKDGTSVYIDSSTVIDTYYIINLTNQVYSVVGLVECELQLNSNNKWLYSPTFGINVDDNLVDGSIVSSNDFIALQDALNRVDNLEDTYAPRLTAVETDKVDKSNIVNNTVTTVEGTVLDGRMGKNLQDQVTTLNNNLGDKFPDNEGAHNSIFRGKYLGSSVTTEQYTAISSGTFTGLYIGDYWTINGINWRIAAFNYYRNTGDSLVPKNHLVIVPDTSLYNHVMNDTNTTEGGYTGSKMYTEGLTQAKAIINNAFSGHVVTFRAYLCNAVSNGEASAGGWVDSTVDLMNEIMVYGSVVNGAAIYGLYNIGTEKSQLPLFALNPQSINTRYNYWLRDVVSASLFANVYGNGFASHDIASNSLAVRPRFLIS